MKMNSNPYINEWYITQEGLDEVRMENLLSKGDNNTTREKATYASYRYDPKAEKSGNVAIISINGALYTYDYKMIASLVEKAENDKEVEKVVFDINSPGGAVAGVFDLANTIRACSKPTFTWTGSRMASAAYILGSATNKIYAAPQAEIGSIGVLAEFVDRSGWEEKNGFKTILMKAKHSDKKALGYDTEEGKAMIQARLDKAEEFFHKHLIESRGITEDYILANFGHGAVFCGEDALKIKMVDGLANNFDEFMSNLGKSTDIEGGGGNLMTLEELKANQPDLWKEVVKEATASAKTKEDEIKAQAQKEERERINAIDKFSKLSAIEGISDLLASAKNDGTSIEDLKVKAFDLVLQNYKPAVVKATEPSANAETLEAMVKDSVENTPDVENKDNTKALTPEDEINAVAKDLANEINKREE